MWPIFRYKIVLFIAASLCGVLVAFLWRGFEYKNEEQRLHVTSSLHDTTKAYQKWLAKQGFEQKALPEEWISYDVERRESLKTEAQFLFENIQVLCVVLSHKKESAKAVKETWAKSCNSVVFWGDYVDAHIPVLQIPRGDSICVLLTHIWLKHRNKFDWLFLSDDETFSVIENLRHYIAPLDSQKTFYLGHPVQRQYFSTPYNLLDAGTVISKGAFYKLAPILDNSNCSSMTDDLIDEELGNLLKNSAEKVNVYDTRDRFGRGRFNSFSPEKMIVPGSISVFDSYWRSSLFLSNEGSECCSNEAITFHGITPIEMHLLQYLVQSLTVFKHSLKGLGNKPARESSSFYSDRSMPLLYLPKSIVKQVSLQSKVHRREDFLEDNLV